MIRDLIFFMRKKLKHLNDATTLKEPPVVSRFYLVLGLMFITVFGLAGCSSPAQYLNDAIANAVGDKRMQRGKVQIIKGQIYDCTVMSITMLGPSGLMEENSKIKTLYTSSPKNISFDENTGVLSGEGFSPLKMTLLQRGSNENTAIGYSTYKGSASSGIAVLRIKSWEVGLPFLFLDSSILLTGSCITN